MVGGAGGAAAAGADCGATVDAGGAAAGVGACGLTLGFVHN